MFFFLAKSRVELRTFQCHWMFVALKKKKKLKLIKFHFKSTKLEYRTTGTDGGMSQYIQNSLSVHIHI